MKQPPLSLIRLIEELAANAWPAPVVQVVDGWRLRFNWGVTGRANSVLPNATGDAHGLEEKVALVERFYAARALPAAFQISPAAAPAHLDAYLDMRHYTRSEPVCVQTASLVSPLTAAASGSTWQVELRDTVDDEWMRTLAVAEGYDEPTTDLRRRPLHLIGPPAAYAIAQLRGKPAAVGRAVYERGWLGLFGMATVPEARRRGAGRTVLLALLEWGRAHGASAAYLQVEASNHPARALYERLGFATLYQYHYRRARM